MRPLSATVAVLVLVGVVGTGLVILNFDELAGGGDAPANATVSELSPRVTVSGADYENETGNGTYTCMASGPTPGFYAVHGRLVVERPVENGDDPAQFAATAWVADDERDHLGNVTLGSGETELFRLRDVVENDGTAAADESVTVHARVTHDGEPVANATRTVEVVEFGEVDCEPAEAIGPVGEST